MILNGSIQLNLSLAVTQVFYINPNCTKECCRMDIETMDTELDEIKHIVQKFVLKVNTDQKKHLHSNKRPKIS